MLMKNSLLSMSTLSLIFVDLGAMQVHFYVVTLVLDVAVLFHAVFPNGFVVVVVEVGEVEVVVPFLLLDVVDFVQDVPLDAMQVLVDDRFAVVLLVVVGFHSEIALFCVVFVVEPCCDPSSEVVEVDCDESMESNVVNGNFCGRTPARS